MKFAFAFALAALAQVPQSVPPIAPQAAPTPSAPAPDAAPAAPLPPWEGTLTEGLAEVRKLARSNQLDAASALCERLLAPGDFARWRERMETEGGWKRALSRVIDPAADVLGLSGTTAPERAEVLYAAGLVSVAGEQRTRGEDEFGRAQSLAGPGELRLVSGFQLGTTALLEGETWRAQIPEIQAKSGAAPGANAQAQPPIPRPPAPNGAGAPGAPEQPPDPLAQARAAYLRARDRFVERLRADWRDADTRANTELVQRRLRELDEIEKQRKEQQQQQQDKQDKDKQDKNDQQKQDKDKQDKSDQDKDKQNPQDKQDENAQKDQDKPEPPKPEDAQKDEQKQDPAKPDEKKDGEQPDPSKMEERQLTKEEMMRLLDLLEQRDEQWKKLQQQLQSARRARAKKDW